MKRFTETAKWDDPWFVRLPMPLKCLWVYICDRCDRSGVIDFCPEVASIQIGADLAQDAIAQFGNRVLKLENGKWQIVKFLPFQYGTVDANCPAHKPVIRLIEANGISYPIKNNPSDRLFNNLKEEDNKKKKEYPITQSTSHYQPKPKEPAPYYPPISPERAPPLTDKERTDILRTAKEEVQKLKLRSA